MRLSRAVVGVLLSAWLVGCEEPPPPEKPAKKPAASAQPKPSAAEPAPPAPEPDRADCPEGSKGPGTSDKPCDAKGTDRMMEVVWTGKIPDEGPSFKVTSRSKLPILYGSIAVYFYDKDGKQLSVPSTEKPRPKQVCSGRIFAGVMKPGEKATINFSCVKKTHVPENTTAIEAEIVTVGFSDEAGTKTDFYWRNESLGPDERPKASKKK